MNKIEIFVVNDGSKDNTSMLAKEIAQEYPDSIFVVDKNNGGHGSTINYSVSKATGKYFKVVDSDDWVDTDGINSLVKELESCEDDLVLNPYHIVNENEEITRTVDCCSNRVKVCSTISYNIEDVADYLNIAMHSFTFKTNILKACKYHVSEKCFYVDTEYTLFPLVNVKTVKIFDFPVYFYLYGTNEQSMNVKNMIKRRDQHLFVIKRVLAFFNENEDCFATKTKNMVAERLKDITRMHYVVLIAMNDVVVSKKEIIAFDNYIKKTNIELYLNVINKAYYSMRLLNVFRKLNFVGYGLIVKSIHLFKLI